MYSVLSGYMCRTYLWTVSHFKKNHSLCLCFISGKIHADYWQFLRRWSNIAQMLKKCFVFAGQWLKQVLWKVISKTSLRIFRSNLFFRINDISITCPHDQLTGRTVIKKLWVFFRTWGPDRSQSSPCWFFSGEANTSIHGLRVGRHG